MPDIFDQASDREQADRDLALQLRKPEGPSATGYCRYCDEPVQDGRRLCSTFTDAEFGAEFLAA